MCAPLLKFLPISTDLFRHNGIEEVHNHIGEMAIQIPTELCQPDIEALITSVYNDFNKNYTKEEYLPQRAILTTTNENVDHINDKKN